MKYITNKERKAKNKKSWKKDFQKNWPLYAIFIPVLIFFVVFNYVPMFGIVMAFQKYSIRKGIFGSDWVGFDNFAKIFQDEQAMYAFRNTCCMALLNLTIGFIIPVIFALLISQVKCKPVRRVMQSVSYMPNFVATVVLCSLVIEFLGETGAITQLFVKLFGIEPSNLYTTNSPGFWFINLFADTWQGCGYAAIVYVAAISNVNPDLYEAAAIDGCSRTKRIFKITIPSILPTVITMFTLRVGLVFKTGFDKIILLYAPRNYEYADVLTSYVYRYAFSEYIDYGLSAALGLLQSVISTVLLVGSNWLSKKVAGSSLFSAGD